MYKYKLTIFICFIFLISLLGCNSKPGTIKGLLSWQYNDLIGTKPDIGANIFLLSKTPPKKLLTSVYDLPEGYYYAKTNGEGKYEINNVKPGKYIVIITSNKANAQSDDPIKKQLDKDILPKYFDKENTETFHVLFINIKKIEIKTIEVKSDSVIDISHDFGNTNF